MASLSGTFFPAHSSETNQLMGKTGTQRPSKMLCEETLLFLFALMADVAAEARVRLPVRSEGRRAHWIGLLQIHRINAAGQRAQKGHQVGFFAGSQLERRRFALGDRKST